MKKNDSKLKFFAKSLFKGLLWFSAILIVFVLLQEEIDLYKDQINKLGDNRLLLYSLFASSEIIFGIIPPEFYMMIWKTKGVLSEYVTHLLVLAVISYAAGVIGYLGGRAFSKARFLRKFIAGFLHKYAYLRKYSGYIVLLGAVTPVPFSATCMLAGTVHFPMRNFLLIALTRIIRFAFYGWLVWSFPEWFS